MKQEFKYLRAQWHDQTKIVDGSKYLILGEQEYFVWDTASLSTKWLDILKIWRVYGPLTSLATPMYVGFIQRICYINTLCKRLRIYITLGPYFLHNNLFIRSFIYSERLPKFSKISFVCNIFDPIPVQEMFLFKGYTKQSPQWTFLCREPSIIKRVWKKLGVASAPLGPPWIRLCLYYNMWCTNIRF